MPEIMAEKTAAQKKLLKEMDRTIAELTSQFLWRHKAVQVNEKEPFRLASGEFAPILYPLPLADLLSQHP